MSFDTQYALEHVSDLLDASRVTIWVTLVSAFIGIFLGLLLAFLRIKKVPVLNTLISLLVSLIRSTPILVQLYVVNYGMPRLSAAVHRDPTIASNITIYPNLVAIITFSLYAGVYFCEIFRAAYFTVDESQREAADSLNIPKIASLCTIIIPQAAINAIPNMSNSTIDMLKNTSLLYNISVMDIMARATIIASPSFKYIELYTVALIIYLMLAICFFTFFLIIELSLKRLVRTQK